MSEIQRKIKFFKDTRKKGTPFFFDENNEIKKGIIKFRYCQLCGKNIEELRNYDPQHVRKVKFCSDNCRKEYNRRRKIRKKLGVDGLFWTTFNGKKIPQRSEMRVSRLGKEEDKFKAKRRKSKNHA